MEQFYRFGKYIDLAEERKMHPKDWNGKHLCPLSSMTVIYPDEDKYIVITYRDHLYFGCKVSEDKLDSYLESLSGNIYDMIEKCDFYTKEEIWNLFVKYSMYKSMEVFKNCVVLVLSPKRAEEICQHEDDQYFDMACVSLHKKESRNKRTIYYLEIYHYEFGPDGGSSDYDVVGMGKVVKA